MWYVHRSLTTSCRGRTQGVEGQLVHGLPSLREPQGAKGEATGGLVLAPEGCFLLFTFLLSYLFVIIIISIILPPLSLALFCVRYFISFFCFLCYYYYHLFPFSIFVVLLSALLYVYLLLLHFPLYLLFYPFFVPVHFFLHLSILSFFFYYCITFFVRFPSPPSLFILLPSLTHLFSPSPNSLFILFRSLTHLFFSPLFSLASSLIY